ncbi:MAG: alpha/beta hydrolase [Propionibacteriaceae bacterium]|jgi:pimeloyl-ACP methyl ester carboxylesterase|nr:alpha/beta hydrolase [Propionibacteriaceae bacterium]
MDQPLPHYAPQLPRTDYHVTRGDADIHVEACGQGRPLIIIHGIGCTSWSTYRVADQLGDIRTVYSVENRGMGESTGPVEGMTIDTMADDAAAVIDALCGGEAVDVLGYSMGGYIAMHLALRRPDLVKSLILCSTSAGGPSATPVPDETLAIWASGAGLSPEENNRITMEPSFHAGWSTDRPDLYEEMLLLRAPYDTPEDVFNAQFLAARDHLMGGIDVSPIQVPVLIIAGTGDRVVPFANSVVMKDLFGSVTFHPVENGGHLMWLEDVDQFTAPIRAFLQAE